MTKMLLAVMVSSIINSVTVVANPIGDLLQRVPETASRYRNPLDQDEQARRAGANLFSQECASCHGKDAKGRQGSSVGEPYRTSSRAGQIVLDLA
jgi:mono/diheme cytochrome c family protein